jgi:hypothetical protein
VTGVFGVYISSSVITLLAALIAMLAFQKSKVQLNEVDQVNDAENRANAVA